MANSRAVARPQPFELRAEIAAAHSHLQDLIVANMAQQDVSRAMLAARLGVTPPRVTQMLDGDKISLDSAIEALYVLGVALEIRAMPQA